MITPRNVAALMWAGVIGWNLYQPDLISMVALLMMISGGVGYQLGQTKG